MTQFFPRVSSLTDFLSLPVCIAPVHILNEFILMNLTDQSSVCFCLLLRRSYSDILTGRYA